MFAKEGPRCGLGVMHYLRSLHLGDRTRSLSFAARHEEAPKHLLWQAQGKNGSRIGDSSASLDYAIGARYHLSGRQDSPSIIIRQQAHPAQEEVQYEAEVDHLRHTRFIGLRDDKDPSKVIKET